MRLDRDAIRLDFQRPENLSEEGVQEKIELILEGQPLDPVVVRFDGKSYYLQDGFHRIEAYRRLGISEVDAEVLPGTLEEMESEWRAGMAVVWADLAKR